MSRATESLSAAGWNGVRKLSAVFCNKGIENEWTDEMTVKRESVMRSLLLFCFETSQR